MKTKYVRSDYLNLTFKLDNEGRCWWWSTNLNTWFPEMNIQPEVLVELPETENPSK